MGTNIKTILVLNDQGGSIMNVSYDVVGTLRSEMGGHAPIILIDNDYPDAKIQQCSHSRNTDKPDS